MAKQPAKPQSKTKKSAAGRPTKYQAMFADQAAKLCLLGYTNEQLADFFGVVTSTIYEWQKNHKEFSDALKLNKDMADAMVVASLYQRALGYSAPETKVFNDQGNIIEHTVTKHYPPDATSAIFWLKNRQSGKWRDKVEQSITLSDDFDAVMSSDDE